MSETGQNLKREAAPVLVYFAVYLTYLFVRPESEFLHWLTLVLLPFLAVYGLRRSWLPDATFNATLHSIGFRRSVLKKGLIAALLLGVALNGLQLVISQRRDEIWEVLSSPAAFVTLPLIFLLLLLTAGFTEEVFFRGFLQTRLTDLFGSNFWAIAVTSVLFSLYHVPYAYLNPNWPSHGDLSAAFVAAFTQAIPGGVILGTLYARSRYNLVAPILLHSLINLLPAATMITVRF